MLIMWEEERLLVAGGTLLPFLLGSGSLVKILVDDIRCSVLTDGHLFVFEEGKIYYFANY